MLLVTAGLAIGVSRTWEGSEGQEEVDREPATSGKVSDPVVANVLDGDTIELADGQRVRLAQIDTPELAEHECYSSQARATLARLLPVGSVVRLRRDPRLDEADRFGRLIRYVVSGATNLNVELVRRGAASVWFVGGDRGRHARRLLAAARRARSADRGLWRACADVRLDTTRGIQTGTR